MPSIRKVAEWEAALTQISELLELIKVKNAVLSGDARLCITADYEDKKKAVQVIIENEEKALRKAMENDRKKEIALARSLAEKNNIELDEADEEILSLGS